MNNSSTLEEELFMAMKEFAVIDAHEHLVPESERIKLKIDVFFLLGGYSNFDYSSAGGKSRKETSHLSVEKRWELFEPFYNKIRWGGFYQDTHIFLRDFYGIKEINRSNCREISERLQAENKPGLYDKILKDKCHIKHVIVSPVSNKDDKPHKNYKPGFFQTLFWVGQFIAKLNREKIHELEAEHNVNVKDLNSLKNVLKKEFQQWRKEGIIGIKISAVHLTEEDPQEADKILRRILKGEIENNCSIDEPDHLHSSLLRYYCRLAEEENITVAVHSGYLPGYLRDFRKLAPSNLIPLVHECENTRFDLFHAGIPYVREAGIMGKKYPNVTLNLCWCPLISPAMTFRILDEYLDLVPINKISVFGGDYGYQVEKVYGHLMLTLKVMSRVFAKKINEEIMNKDEALYIAKKLLYENPKEIYKI